ncbi:methyltransferase domain-containing protein [Massilia sp. W12]|uniref:class I SAM-dependent methyltransferase n=1 Tax=Massilia sp. W12 TaxID=3126507 RepID=UPI0030D2DBFF
MMHPANPAELDIPVSHSLPSPYLESGLALDPHAHSSSTAELRYVLHVGCGRAAPERLPACFRNPQWREVRLDIDPAVEPDVVASITDLSVVQDACVDAVWSSHNLEHLEAYQVPLALAEFRRVLKSDGFALITLPDLRAIARQILSGNLENTLYEAPCGPIRPIDMLFGHQDSLAAGKVYMAHRCGFTADTLGQALAEAGFDEVRVIEGKRWDLWALATMPDIDPAIFDELAKVSA